MTANLGTKYEQKSLTESIYSINMLIRKGPAESLYLKQASKVRFKKSLFLLSKKSANSFRCFIGPMWRLLENLFPYPVCHRKLKERQRKTQRLEEGGRVPFASIVGYKYEIFRSLWTSMISIKPYNTICYKTVVQTTIRVYLRLNKDTAVSIKSHS